MVGCESKIGHQETTCCKKLGKSSNFVNLLNPRGDLEKLVGMVRPKI